MWKNLVIAGSVGAAVLGSGAVALASSGSSAPSATPTISSATTAAASTGKGPLARVLRRALHGEWVTRDRKHSGTYVQHDAIRGAVTAVSITSITVRAADNVSETYIVNSATKVRVKGSGGGGSIGAVKVGDNVGVLGTGDATMTATRVLDAGSGDATMTG